ncbi:MAG TPA: response regulator [Candidatus Angelobacter sp.]|jgi:CheY-like chemotaxis protein|nr:response regulator [Candidatus Angelobacter sp.]
MVRPTVLVAEPEPAQALSVRKLVLETAKFNVLTAHSTHEALEIFGLFPNINAAVLAPGDDIECEAIARQIKSVTRKIPVIGIRCEDGDHTVPSYEPEVLLGLLRELLGDPRNLEQPKAR